MNEVDNTPRLRELYALVLKAYDELIAEAKAQKLQSMPVPEMAQRVFAKIKNTQLFTDEEIFMMSSMFEDCFNKENSKVMQESIEKGMQAAKELVETLVGDCNNPQCPVHGANKEINPSGQKVHIA